MMEAKHLLAWFSLIPIGASQATTATLADSRREPAPASEGVKPFTAQSDDRRLKVGAPVAQKRQTEAPAFRRPCDNVIAFVLARSHLGTNGRRARDLGRPPVSGEL